MKNINTRIQIVIQNEVKKKYSEIFKKKIIKFTIIKNNQNNNRKQYNDGEQIKNNKIKNNNNIKRESIRAIVRIFFFQEKFALS